MSRPEPPDGNPSPGGTPSPSGQGMTPPVATPPPAPAPAQPNQTNQPNPTAVPQPPTNQHRIELATGQVYTGATPEEAVNNLKAAQEEASRTIEQYKLQLRQMAAQQALHQNQPAVTTPTRQAPQPQTATASGAFNKQQFEQLLDSDDPGEAIIYALQTKLGYNPMERLDEVHQGYGKINDLIEVGRFYQQDKDFPSNDPMSQQLLVDTATRIGNGTVNMYSLQMAANQLRSNNLIPQVAPGGQNSGQNQPVGQFQQNPYTQAMSPSPAVSGTPSMGATDPNLSGEEAKWAEFAQKTGITPEEWEKKPFQEQKRLLEENGMIEIGMI